LAEELFAMHFFYRFPGGFEFSGVVAVALLFALVGGLLIHLKDLRRQAWQFRPEKKLRVSASDAHKVLGIFGLPFSLVLSWSGAILCLAGLVTQGLATTTFHGNVRQVQELRGHSQPERPPTHREAAMLSMDSIVRRAQELYATDDAPDFVALERRRDESAWVGVSFPTHASRDFGVRRYLAFDGVTGQPLSDADARQTPAHRFEKVMMDLHFGRYGGRFVEVLYALLALALCAVILTGNIIWLERRDAKRSRLGNRVLARLTAGVSAGAVAASAAYFAVNRVLPWRLEGRVTTELRVFFLAWAAAIASAFLVRRSARDVTSWLLFAAALLFGAVVIADVARFDANVLTALARGLPDVFVAELVLISLALGSTVLGATLRASRKCSPTKASNASASCSA
ncbi:MAG TPA: PepSY-associated TM helix domain-containing protein, partial [Labilithrix sp.]|nr:PepSY-associated TM helix domain-containing protein [Labilithrix sp.]